MNTVTNTPSSTLALLGGSPAVRDEPGDLFTWPILTVDDENAVLKVLRTRAMSGISITQQFEKEFEEWMGVRHALGFNNGTAALLAAMFAVGIGQGDELFARRPLTGPRPPPFIPWAERWFFPILIR